jgi:hypothetical protein
VAFDYRRWVCRLIVRYGCSRIAEIGVYKSQLARMIWAIPTVEYLLLVDPWDAQWCRPITRDGKRYTLDSRTNWTQEEMDRLYDWAITNKTEATEVMRVTSLKAASMVPDGSLDFVFIDAMHFYEELCEDIAAWKPKLRQGGVLAGDDFTTRFPGVQKAVEEKLPGYQRQERVWWKTV